LFFFGYGEKLRYFRHLKDAADKLQNSWCVCLVAVTGKIESQHRDSITPSKSKTLKESLISQNF